MYGSGASIAIRGALGPLERGRARAGFRGVSPEKKEPHPASGSDGAPRDESQERVDVSRLARGWSQGHALHDSVSGARVRRSCCGRGRKTPPTRGPRPAKDRKEGPSSLPSHSRGVRGGPEAEGGSPFLGLGSARAASRPGGAAGALRPVRRIGWGGRRLERVSVPRTLQGQPDRPGPATQPHAGPWPLLPVRGPGKFPRSSPTREGRLPHRLPAGRSGAGSHPRGTGRGPRTTMAPR